MYAGVGNIRVCFYINKAIDINKWTPTHHSADICTIKLEGHERTIQIHNIYNPQQTNSSLRVIPELLRTEGEQILLGDFNLHHPFWGGAAVTSADEAADDLIRATEVAGLSLATEAGMETWAKGTSTSTLDLVFTSPWITDRLLQSQRQDRWHTGSDHFPIAMEVDVEAPKGPPPPRRLLWKKANWKAVQSELVG